MVVLTRMNKILEIRLRDALALVEPGVLNLQLTNALAMAAAASPFFGNQWNAMLEITAS